MVVEVERCFDIICLTIFPNGFRTSFIATSYTRKQIPIPPSLLPSFIFQLRFSNPVQLGPSTPIQFRLLLCVEFQKTFVSPSETTPTYRFRMAGLSGDVGDAAF